VFPEKVFQIHTVELIPGEYKIVRRVLGAEVNEIFPHRVGCSLKPTGMFKSLFRSEDLDKAAGKGVKVIRLSEVEMERR
jgi:hypothetical protein